MATPRKPATSSGGGRSAAKKVAVPAPPRGGSAPGIGTTASVDEDADAVAVAVAAASATAPSASSASASASASDPRRSEPPLPPPVSVPPPPLPSGLAALRSRQHQTKMLRSALTALAVWGAVVNLGLVLGVAWKWSRHSSTSPSSAGDAVDAQLVRAIEELERIRPDLQRQLDDYDLALGRVQERRVELQPLRERLAGLRKEAAEKGARTIDDQVEEDGEGGEGSNYVADDAAAFPRLDELLAHLRQRQDANNEHDDATARVRELFFRARNELYVHSQQQHQQGGGGEPSDAAATSTSRSTNYTVVNSVLQSYGDLRWHDILPRPSGCRDHDDAAAVAQDPSSSAAAASWTPADIDAWLSTNEDVRDRVSFVQQLLMDRIGVDDREWKVGLEDTYERVQQWYMEVAASSNSRVLRQMKELQQHLDHWEVRQAQKGTSSPSEAEHAAKAASAAVPTKRCTQPSQVLHWIDVALDAHYRNRSVREALLTALGLDDNVDQAHVYLATSELAPDPAMDSKTSRRRSSPPSLRLLLDTPLLHQSELWIDRLVEYLEGRHDTIDAWVDALVARASASAAGAAPAVNADGATSPGDNDDNASIGRYLVRSFLEGVGRVVDDRLPPWLYDKSPAPAASK